MRSFAKTLVIATLPPFLAGGVAGAFAATGAPTTQPATPSATQPATQPGVDTIADSNAPLIIPDGTSREHPGPSQNPVWQGQMMEISGIRR